MSPGRMWLAMCVASVGWLSMGWQSGANAEPPAISVRNTWPYIATGCFTAAELRELRGLPSRDLRLDVDLFAAQQAGQLQIRYQPRNERSAHVQIRNLTNQPLTVRLPTVFAARPVLAQNNPFLGGPQQNASSGSSSQTVAGPFGNNNRNGNNNQQIPNIFNQFQIAPEGLVQFDVQSVCLEQGLPTPTPGSRYEMVAIVEVLSEPETITEVLTQLRDKQISPKVAQAAAWHASELSGYPNWQKLAEIKGELTTIGRHPYFAPNELKQARALLERIETTRTTPVESLANAKKL